MKCPHCGQDIKKMTQEDILMQLVPNRYAGRKNEILEIVGIYKNEGNKTIVEILKSKGIISPKTYWADVRFVSNLLQAKKSFKESEILKERNGKFRQS